MRTITVNLDSRRYDIVIETGSFFKLGLSIEQVLKTKTIGIVSDTTVWSLYGSQLTEIFNKQGFKTSTFLIQPGESSKTINEVIRLCREFIQAGLDRGTAIIAFGGGVVGDIAGFAAALFLRGVDFVQVPTTLLADCDSSVGGKVGVNLDGAKNLIGTFYQPKQVIIDPVVLKTLPQRELIAGLAETIKTGLIRDPELYQIIFDHLGEIQTVSSLDIISDCIYRSISVKSEIISRDEKESGLRRILNFGHTVGHSLEGVLGSNIILHGEAVLLGMFTAIEISYAKNILHKADYKRIYNDLLRLPVSVDITFISYKQLASYIKKDKKMADGRLNFVVLESIGNAYCSQEVTEGDIEQAFKSIQQHFHQ
jgi:3-dehydroquinate synthase